MQLINACVDDRLRETAVNALVFVIMKHGLSADLVDYVYGMNDRITCGVVNEAITHRNQYEMVRKMALGTLENQRLWEAFCRSNPNIWHVAQKEMQLWMFESFYATGHHLSESAQVYFFSLKKSEQSDILNIAKVILKHEKNLSDKMMCVVRTNPEVYAVYLSMVQTGR